MSQPAPQVMLKMERYIVSLVENSELSIKIALALYVKICEKLGPKDAILLVPQRGTIQNVEEEIGEKLAERLLNRGTIKIKNVGNLRLRTKRTFQEFKTSDIIIGVHITEEMLEQLDKAKNTAAVIIVPLVDNEVKKWIHKWNPVVINTI